MANTASSTNSPPSNGPSASPLVQDPQSEQGKPFLPDTDSTISRFRNFYRMMTGSMSPSGQRAYWADVDRRYEELDCKRCESQRDYLLQYSPVITYLSKHINQLGGEINSSNIYCRRCDEEQAGGFDPVYGIKICANRMKSQNHLEDTIAHEMVHAYDCLRWKSEWKGNLRHAACTEIRASSLSGECRWSREFFGRNQWKLTQHHQDCVRRRATLSVAARPFCPNDTEAAKAVNEVWESCFRDTRPFDEIYR